MEVLNIKASISFIQKSAIRTAAEPSDNFLDLLFKLKILIAISNSPHYESVNRLAVIDCALPVCSRCRIKIEALALDLGKSWKALTMAQAKERQEQDCLLQHG